MQDKQKPAVKWGARELYKSIWHHTEKCVLSFLSMPTESDNYLVSHL